MDAFLDRIATLAGETAQLQRRTMAVLRTLHTIAREAGDTAHSAAVALLIAELDASAAQHMGIALDCFDPTPPPGEIPANSR